MNKLSTSVLRSMFSFGLYGYIALFFAAIVFYIVGALFGFFLHESFSYIQLLWWVLVGLSMSLLASLCTWPVALSIVTLIEQSRGRNSNKHLRLFLRYLASFPLILYTIIFVEVIRGGVFLWIESFWTSAFASVNLFTQGLAFALTLLLYPLSILPVFNQKLTIDLFFQKMLTVVINFAEVGFVTSLVVLCLMIVILPRMVLQMERHLQSSPNQQSLEVIQSIGGTLWESIYMTVLQSMRKHFDLIITQFTRFCFFEGLVTYVVVQYFFYQPQVSLSEAHWGQTLSAAMLDISVQPLNRMDQLLIVAGVLSLCFILFKKLEQSYLQRLEADYV